MMASDNEDDDLEALRMAALATLKQKAQPIEKVISGGLSASRPKDSPPWSDVPASMDFPVFSDPIPDSNPFMPYEAAAVTLAPHRDIKPWPPSNTNGNHPVRHGFPRFGFGGERNFVPRFPRQTFGGARVGGPRFDHGNRRFRRDYLPPQQSNRGLTSQRIPPGHLANPQLPQGSAANLIVIQPLTPDGPQFHPALMNNSSIASRNEIKDQATKTSTATTKLVLPQDKYCSSPNRGTNTNHQVTDQKTDVKVTDKFSRYDKSDSEDDDLSDVDDIANEIDKVLQDDFLGPEAMLKVEETKTAEVEDAKAEDVNSSSGGTDLSDEKEAVEEKLDTLQVSGAESNCESLDLDSLASKETTELDALAGEEPPDLDVLANVEPPDLDALAGKEPPDLDVLASKEPTDLDALVSEEPTGDLEEDLDCLVDQEPESKFRSDKGSSRDGKHYNVESNKNRDCGNFSSSLTCDKKSIVDRDNTKKFQKDVQDSQSTNPSKQSLSMSPSGQNQLCRPSSASPSRPNSLRKSSVSPLRHTSLQRRSISPPRQSSLRRPSVSPSHPSSLRKSSLSPLRHRRPSISPSRQSYYSRVRQSTPPRRYDSYYSNSPSSRRSRSPLLYPSNRRSRSPRRSPPRRSPYRKLSPRRSLSPQGRRSPGGFGGRRRLASPTRSHFAERDRMNPSRRSFSPKNRMRDDKRDTRSARVNDPSRLGANDSLTKPHSVHRDRSRLWERDKLGRHSATMDSIQVDKSKELDTTQTDRSHPKHKTSPTETRKASPQEKVMSSLDNLTPEELAKIEARKEKFDSKTEVKITDTTSKTISLKSIKTREKKQKKKEGKEKEDIGLTKLDKKPSGGISLKQLRKKQKKKEEQVASRTESPKAVRVADLEDDSEDSEEDRSWKKESGAATLSRGIGFPSSRMSKRASPSQHRVDVKTVRKDTTSSRKHRVDERQKNTISGSSSSSRRERVKLRQKLPNNWSSDDDDDEEDSINVSNLSSRVMPTKPPDQLRIQVQVLPKEKTKKKSTKSVPEYSEARLTTTTTTSKRSYEEIDLNKSDSDGEEEEVPVKKHKKKKEKKKKHHSKTTSPPKSSTTLTIDEMDMLEASKKSLPKTSVLDRLGKKVDLNSSSEKKKKKSKKSHSTADGGGSKTDLDQHIRKMKAKNEEIIRRQREIQLDKEKYG